MIKPASSFRILFSCLSSVFLIVQDRSLLFTCSATGHFVMSFFYSCSDCNQLFRSTIHFVQQLVWCAFDDTAGDRKLGTHASKVVIDVSSSLATFVDAPISTV